MGEVGEVEDVGGISRAIEEWLSMSIARSSRREGALLVCRSRVGQGSASK